MPEQQKAAAAGYVAAVGMFDGVHLGHRFVVERLVGESRERGLSPMIVTFRRHPLEVIAPGRAPRLITGAEQKERLLLDLGVERVCMLDFDRSLRSLTAAQFMQRLHDEYGVRVLMIGYDHCFGSDCPRGIEAYRAIGEQTGVEVIGMPALAPSGEQICSSMIRRLLSSGDVATAAKALGHPFSITGVVEHGRQLGRTIGFPTANLRLADDAIVPHEGVYAAAATMSDGLLRPAMVNIGRRPTVDRPGADLSIEAHILDFDGSLYDETLSLTFCRRLRDERRFDSLEELKEALAADAAATRKALGEMP